MKKYSVEEAIDIGNKVTLVVVAAVTFAVGVVLVRLLWAWTIPDLFPAAVEQGWIASTLTWLAAIKVTTFAAILASTRIVIAGPWARGILP